MTDDKTNELPDGGFLAPGDDIEVSDRMVDAACYRSGMSHLNESHEEWRATREVIRWALANGDR